MKFALSKEKSFLGIQFYRKYRASKALKRVFLGGIYSEIIKFEDYGESSREARFFGVPIWGRKLTKESMVWYLGWHWRIKEIKISEQLQDALDELFVQYDVNLLGNQKHVFIFWANSGEIAILLSYFWTHLLRRLGIKNEDDFVVLCTKPYHKEMLQFYFPKTRVVIAKPRVLRYVLGDMDAGMWRVHMCFPGKYFARFEATSKKIAINYLNWMADWLNLPILEPSLPNEGAITKAYNSAIKKLSKLQREALEGENGKGLAIMAMEAFSCVPVDRTLIEKERENLRNEGFEIYENVANRGDPRFLSYPEFFAVAQKSQRLVGLRSGLIDFVANSGVPLKIFYTRFPDRGFNTPEKAAIEVFELFSLKSLKGSIEHRSLEEVIIQ